MTWLILQFSYSCCLSYIFIDRLVKGCSNSSALAVLYIDRNLVAVHKLKFHWLFKPLYYGFLCILRREDQSA